MKITATSEIEVYFKSIESFKKSYPQYTITAIDDVEVIGSCEICGQPVLVTDGYHLYADGVVTCMGCEEKSNVPPNDL